MSEMQRHHATITRAGIPQSVDVIPEGGRQTAYDYGWGAKMLPPLTEDLVWRVAERAVSEGQRVLAARAADGGEGEETPFGGGGVSWSEVNATVHTGTTPIGRLIH